MGVCDWFSALGVSVVVLAGIALLVFLIHVCCWAYKNRDVHERVRSLPGWKDLDMKFSSRADIDSWEWKLTKNRLRELEDRLLILETAPKPEPPKKR